MQRHAVLGQHAAGPGAAVETNPYLYGLLHGDFQTPGTELLRHPVLGVVQHVRAHEATAYVAGNIGSVLHDTVICAPELEHSLGDLVLRSERQCKQDADQG